MNEEVEDRAIVIGSRLRRGALGSVPALLASLNIQFKTKRRRPFWLTNEAELPYIYHDLCRRAREVKCELHPQNGGDRYEFSAFVEVVEAAKRYLEKRGCGNGFAAKPTPAESSVRKERQRQNVKRWKREHRARCRLHERKYHARRRAAALKLAA